MNYIAFDTETFPIVQHGKATRNSTPRFVCLTWYDGDEAQITKDRDRALDLFTGWLEDQSTTIIAHNASYDVLVMLRLARELGVNLWPAVFDAYGDQRIRDTRIREILKDLATTGNRRGYDLARLEKKYLSRDRSDQKTGEDVWRLRYNELAPWPVDTWPEEAIDYALYDAIGAFDVFQAQCAQEYSCLDTPLVDGDRIINEHLQTCADFSAAINGSWGMSVDLEKTEEMIGHYEEIRAGLEEELEAAGLLVDGTMKRAKKIELIKKGWKHVGEDPRLTDTGGISTDKKTREYLRVQGYSDPIFKSWAEYDKAGKYLSTYLEPLHDAYPYAVCPYFNVLVDTGRLSSSGPNAHNIPARGRGAEIRECFIPRPGNVLVQCDFSSYELRTLAQCCINLGIESRLAEAYQKGLDPHLIFACEMEGWDYDKIEKIYGNEARSVSAQKDHPQYAQIKSSRSLAKVANFGYPGGLGAKSFVDFALSWGIEISEQKARDLKEYWMQTWPEVKQYLAYINAQARFDGKVPLPQHAPNGAINGWRIRLAPRYTSACNSLFQGLASDGLKLAMWRAVREMHTDPKGALYGWKLFVNVHDELIIEGPEDRAEPAAKRLSEIMVGVGEIFTPDVPLEAEPEIMDRWRK